MRQTWEQKHKKWVRLDLNSWQGHCQVGETWKKLATVHCDKCPYRGQLRAPGSRGALQGALIWGRDEKGRLLGGGDSWSEPCRQTDRPAESVDGCSWQGEQCGQALKKLREHPEGPGSYEWCSVAWMEDLILVLLSGHDNSGPWCPCLHNDDSGFKDPNIKSNPPRPKKPLWTFPRQKWRADTR